MAGYFSAPFEKFLREDAFNEWSNALSLLDVMETYFDSRVDLLQRRLQKQTDRLKMRAEEVGKEIRKIRSPGSGEPLADNWDREMQKMKLKMSVRMTKLSAAWDSAKVVRTREKISFFFGVHSLLISALLFGLAPQWVHVAYTLQALYLLPMRAYKYKKRAWHYFLFDLCYYSTILNFVYLWIAPSSPWLFVSCYCLAHGSLGTAVITWRNSLVFHDSDKVTSLFVHIYAPFTFTTIRHFYPNAEERFPALKELQHLQPWRALALSGMIYTIWQLLYWKFVLVDRRKKIESGQRTTSFSWMLNDKRGVIGRILSSVPAGYREATFMGGQLIYGVVTELPAVFLFYDSPRWSGAFLLAIFAVSVWNGGGYYIEVFGRKFERELEALRKELADAASKNASAASSSVGVMSDTAESGRASPTSDAGGVFSSPDGSPVLKAKSGRPVSPPMPSIDLALGDTTSTAEKKEQ